MALAFLGSDVPIPIILPGIDAVHQLSPRTPLYSLFWSVEVLSSLDRAGIYQEFKYTKKHRA